MTDNDNEARPVDTETAPTQPDEPDESDDEE